jgi:hypothetical protein
MDLRIAPGNAQQLLEQRLEMSRRYPDPIPVKPKKVRRVKLIFAWYDFWVGLFWDKKKRWLYIFPIPCFGLVIQFKTPK